jgi:Lon protease-like protein
MMSEGDYLSVASEVFESNIVAIVQPRPAFTKGAKNKAFSAGCAGRITEVGIGAADGDVAINIRGVCRFDTVSEIPPDGCGIERVMVAYDRYRVDTETGVPEFEFNKSRLMCALDIYFKNLEIAPNWQEIEQTPADVLISALAMACPLHPSERQSLLETVDIKERSDMITKIIEMNSLDKLNATSTVN